MVKNVIENEHSGGFYPLLRVKQSLHGNERLLRRLQRFAMTIHKMRSG
jgi:hypothetical protein